MKRLAAVLLLCLATVVVQADSAYTISTLAGSDWVGDGGPATQAILEQAEGVAVDRQGNVYVSEAQGHRVRQISPTGLIRTVAGRGIRGFSGDGGLATDAQLNAPYGLALDPAGNLYIADLGNGRVRRVGTDGRISTVAYKPLISPRNLAVDSTGAVYISDFDGHRVYKLSPSGTLDPFAGTGSEGFSGEAGPALNAKLGFPAALGVDRDDSLFIGDTGNHALRKVTRGFITSVARIASPTGLAIDPAGTLLVADPSAGLIYRIGPSGQTTTVGVTARDVALAPDGSLYIAAIAYVRRLQPSSILTTVAGGGNLAYGDHADARGARLNRPSGVASDALGNVYVADRDNHRIRKISLTGVITTVAGTGDPGDTGEGGSALDARLNKPSSVTVDAAGNLYIADTGNRRIRRVTPQGQILHVWSGFSPEYALADASGAVYVADSGTVVRITNGAGVLIAGGFKSIGGMTLDRGGNLYVTDVSGARVVCISPSRVVTDVAQAAWVAPRGVAVDDSGNVYVADSGRQQIVRADPSGTVGAIAGTGAAGFSGDGDAAILAQLSLPSDVALGPGGKLYIADLDNNRIRVLSPAVRAPAEQVVLADAVNAASGLAGPLAPGMLVLIRGTGLQPGDIPETTFRFGPTLGQFLSIDSQGILVLAPDNLPTSGSFDIDIRRRGVPWMRIPAVAYYAAPGLYSVPTNQAAASNENGSMNSSANPAAQGSIVALYGTGLGSRPEIVEVRIDGRYSEVLYAGPAGFLPGIFQINVRIPIGVWPTPEILVSVGDARSQPGLTLSVR